jgi:hypothetical protein
MAELKHTFVKGRMNKDLDERLIPNGEYRDALNIQVSSSEGSDAGAIENILGNEKVFDLGLTNATCIGTAKDVLNKKIYWFVSSDELNGIYEYDTVNNIVDPVLIDIKTTTEVSINNGRIDPSNDGVILRGVYPTEQKNIFFNGNTPPAYNLDLLQSSESVCRNNVKITCSDPKLEFIVPRNTIIKSATDSIASPSILLAGVKYTGEIIGNLNFSFKYVTESVLNFDSKYFILGTNIIDGLLFFTDGLNEPKVIDIDKFKHYSSVLKQSDGTILKDTSTTVRLYNNSTRTLLEKDICVAKKAPQKSPELDLRRTLREGNTIANGTFNFYKDGALVLPSNEDPTIKAGTNLYPASGWKEGDIIVLEFEGEDKEYEATLKINSIKLQNGYPVTTYQVLSYSEQPENKDGYNVTATLSESDPIYELKFPRFAYRWKYLDNTYSTFSPFSAPAFIPKEFDYDGKNGFNNGVVNDLRRLTLLNIDKGDDTVKSIDILLKFDDDNNVYIVDSKNRNDIETDTLSFEITKEAIKSTVPNLQLLRQWDNVPKKALAQEMVGNRIIYGNYYQNYNIPYEPKFSVSPVITDGNFKRSIKSNRNYEIGVVYVDKFNRQTPVLASDSSSYFLDKSFADKNTALSVKLNNLPPAWATHFKYFIKETSAEYYNLAVDKFYFDDENGFCFVSFPSSERNKITEDSYLLLKKQHGGDNPVLETNNRYKIIDISAEPPEFITERLSNIDSLSNLIFCPTFGDGAVQTTKRAGSTPVENNNVIQIRDVNSDETISSGTSGLDGFQQAEKENLKTGNYVKFTTPAGEKTKAYKIKKVQYHTPGDDECEITFENPFGSDVNVLYVDPFDDSSAPKERIGMEIFKTDVNAGDREFDGRFFVKIQSNSTLTRFGKLEEQTLGLKNYFNTFTTAFDGKDRWTGRPGGGGVPSVDMFVYAGGDLGGGTALAETGERIDIAFEMTNRQANSAFIDNIVVGSLLKFSNHDTIYRVGQKFERTRGGGEKRIALIFKDEEGNHTPLTEKVVKYQEILKIENLLTVSILKERDESGIPFTDNPAIFETEPVRQKTELDIYYENDIAHPISEHNDSHTLNWYNCFSFNNGVESNRIRDDFNAPFIKNGVKASTVLEEGYQEEHKFNGLIWSGIINSKSSVNNSNQFIQAETITKDFLPSYGKIQKLHTWDNAMVILLENKVLRVYANKSQLFDANGNGTLTSTNRVIGDPQEYNGEYGISNDPQSFAAFGFRCYFVDRKNGKVLRLSKDGLTPISNVNMNDFFRDRLATKQAIFGSFDERNKIYNISFTDEEDTVCFSESVNGWVTRKSFVPQNAVSINSKYFTFNNGNLWQHASTVASRNNFYGEQSESFVQFEINEEPSAIKRFKTLSYEGSKDWVATVETNEEKSSEIFFINKEGKYFSNIKGEVKFDSETASNLDLKKFNFQGIGKSSSQDVIEDSRVRTTLSFKVSTSLTGVTSQTRELTNLYPGELIIQTTVSVEISPSSGDYKLIAGDFSGANCTFTQNGDNVIVTYTHGITRQPNTSKIINIPIQGGRLIQKTIDVTVTRNVETNNCTSSIGPNTFTITGVPGHVYGITSDIISANEGFNLPAGNVSINNSQINTNSSISQSANGLTEVQTNESITIENGMTAVSYTITANAEEIIIPNKLLTSKIYNSDTLLNEREQRNLKIIGQAGAIIRYVLNDGSSDLSTNTLTISDSGETNVSLDFTATDYNVAKTYTLTFSAGNKTEFNESFGSQTITFTRSAKAQKKLEFKAYHEDSVSDAVQTKLYAGFGGQTVKNDEVSLQFTLNSSYDYGIIKQPKSDDFVFSNNNANNVSISNIVISVDSTNEHIVTLKFIVNTGSIDYNEIVSIELDEFVNRKITITIDYADANKASDYNGSFVGGLSTITGIAGALNDDFDLIQYEIAMNATFQLLDGEGEDALKADEFKLYDASSGGNDVTETYDNNNELFLTYSDVTTGATIALQPKAFTFPTTNTTLYIRPGRDITESIPATPPNDFFVKINGINPYSDVYPSEENTNGFIKPVFNGATNITWPTIPINDGANFKPRQSAKITETSSIANTKRLVQFVYDIDRSKVDGRAYNVSKWAVYSNNNYSLLGEDSNIIEEAAAGTYTGIDGTSTTITGPYVISNNGLKLTINLLVDIEYVTSNNKTLTTLIVRTPIDHSPSSYITSGIDSQNNQQFAFKTKADACDSNSNSLVWKVYNVDGKKGQPKIGSFISGELSGPDPNLTINFLTPLWSSSKRPKENSYFKDFTNSKIYQLDDKGVIVQIMDLCQKDYNWNSKDIKFGIYGSDLFPASKRFEFRLNESDSSIAQYKLFGGLGPDLLSVNDYNNLLIKYALRFYGNGAADFVDGITKVIGKGRTTRQGDIWNENFEMDFSINRINDSESILTFNTNLSYYFEFFIQAPVSIVNSIPDSGFKAEVIEVENGAKKDFWGLTYAPFSNRIYIPE